MPIKSQAIQNYADLKVPSKTILVQFFSEVTNINSLTHYL